ncbi:hypothetical protein [Chlamydiifrater phoenicopteri]|uniref:hypothetical protein n=1 Tax=Chlamydiifrater phoenicopteri TaxID=2681469 RepID=UPI001BCB9232|nr:hypothetical protein [Chlamydiifrater phoenicopteri]
MSSPIGSSNSPTQTPPLSPQSSDSKEDPIIISSSSEESDSDEETSSLRTSTLSHSARAMLALESLRASLTKGPERSSQEVPSTSKEVVTESSASMLPSISLSSRRTQLTFQVMQLHREGFSQAVLFQACEKLQISLNQQLKEGAPFSDEQLKYLRQICQSVVREAAEKIKRRREELGSQEKHLPLKKRKIYQLTSQTPLQLQATASQRRIESSSLQPQLMSEELFFSLEQLVSLATPPQSVSAVCSHKVAGTQHNENSCPNCPLLKSFIERQKSNFELLFQLRMLFQAIAKEELLNAFLLLPFISDALFKREEAILSNYELACILELCPSGETLLLQDKVSPLSQLKIYKALASLLATQGTDSLSLKIRSLWRKASGPVPNPENISSLQIINKKGSIEAFNKELLSPLLSSLHRVYYQKKAGVKGEITLRKTVPASISFSNFVIMALTYTLSLMMDDPSCKEYFFISTKGLTCSSKIVARILALILNATTAHTIKIFPCKASLPSREGLDLPEELREELFRELRNLILKNNPKGVPGGWAHCSSKK